MNTEILALDFKVGLEVLNRIETINIPEDDVTSQKYVLVLIQFMYFISQTQQKLEDKINIFKQAVALYLIYCKIYYNIDYNDNDNDNDNDMGLLTGGAFFVRRNGNRIELNSLDEVIDGDQFDVATGIKSGFELSQLSANIMKESIQKTVQMTEHQLKMQKLKEQRELLEAERLLEQEIAALDIIKQQRNQVSLLLEKQMQLTETELAFEKAKKRTQLEMLNSNITYKEYMGIVSLGAMKGVVAGLAVKTADFGVDRLKSYMYNAIAEGANVLKDTVVNAGDTMADVGRAAGNYSSTLGEGTELVKTVVYVGDSFLGGIFKGARKLVESPQDLYNYVTSTSDTVADVIQNVTADETLANVTLGDLPSTEDFLGTAPTQTLFENLWENIPTYKVDAMTTVAAGLTTTWCIYNGITALKEKKERRVDSLTGVIDNTPSASSNNSKLISTIGGLCANLVSPGLGTAVSISNNLLRGSNPTEYVEQQRIMQPQQPSSNSMVMPSANQPMFLMPTENSGQTMTQRRKNSGNKGGRKTRHRVKNLLKRVSKKRVSRKRVSRKRVSRKRVSRRKH